jgi:hypothetical protein
MSCFNSKIIFLMRRMGVSELMRELRPAATHSETRFFGFMVVSVMHARLLRLVRFKQIR